MMTGVDPNGFMSTKFDFSQAYNASAPTNLVEVYRRLDYCVPHHVEDLVAKLLRELMSIHGLSRARVVDIGCSYGFNAMLLQHGMTVDHITSETLDTWAMRPELARERFRAPSQVDVLGIDPSVNAIDFCRRTGVQQWSFAGNLETEPLPPDLHDVAAGANLVLSSGAYGYISERSVCQILEHVPDPSKVWVGNFALTPLNYESSALAFADYGLVTEAAPVLFPHRRFSSPAERIGTIETLRRAGVNTDAEQEHDYLFTRFYLSRPAADLEFDLDGFWRSEIPKHTRTTLVPDRERPEFPVREFTSRTGA